MCRNFSAILAVGLLSLATAVSEAQVIRLNRPSGGRSVLMKPGFDFDSGDYPALAGFGVDADELEPDAAPVGVLARELALSNATQRLRVVVAVSHVGSSGLPAVLSAFVDDSEMEASDRLVDGASVGITLGEERLVGALSTPASIFHEFAFRRQNILVIVEEQTLSAGPTVDLLAVGSQIDAAIAALPDLTQSAFDALRPSIATFSAVPTTLSVYQSADLTLTATDPSSLPLAAVYVHLQGDVLLGAPDKYVAGSQTGAQTLMAVVYDTNLMFSSASIVFTVTP